MEYKQQTPTTHAINPISIDGSLLNLLDGIPEITRDNLFLRLGTLNIQHKAYRPITATVTQTRLLAVRRYRCERIRWWTSCCSGGGCILEFSISLVFAFAFVFAVFAMFGAGTRTSAVGCFSAVGSGDSVISPVGESGQAFVFALLVERDADCEEGFKWVFGTDDGRRSMMNV